MDLVKEITRNVKIVLKNRIEEQAVENLLYAKVAHLFALKDIKFVSINNLKKPATLAYYAVNFISSGGSKNQSVTTIEDFVLPFIKDEYEKINKQVCTEMLEKELEFLDSKSKNYFAERKKLEKKYENYQAIKFKTNGGTPASIYEALEKIEKYKKGALFAQITEFSDYFRTSVENNISANKSFLDCLNNLYEGLFEPSDSMGTCRRELKGIPFSLIFMSDIEEILEENNNKNFKKRLKSGYARRINFYFDKDINYIKNPPEKPKKDEILMAYDNLQFCSALIQKKYEEIPSGTILQFSDTANDLLEDWFDECEKNLAEFFKYDDYLTLENNIKKIELYNSTWKITKMAVLIHLLSDDKGIEITENSVLKAIDFYKKCRKSLFSIISEKQLTNENALVSYYLDHIGEVVKKNDIRALNLCNKNYFAKWYKETKDEVKDMLEEKGFELIPVLKYKNTDAHICQKIIPAKERKINVSYSNDTYGEHPSKNFEFVECSSIDAFKDLILNSKALSAQKFEDGHRTDNNAVGEQNTVWLDFDEGLTLDKAKKIFKDYWYVIYTTPHHQKNKDKKPACDRFRVVLKTKTSLPIDKNEYKEVMGKILDKYGSDKQCNNISRYYRGNADAEIFVNENGGYFDWTEFKPVEEEKKIKKIKIKNVDNESGLNDDTIFTELGDKILKSEEYYDGNRDFAFTYSIGVLIKAVKLGNLSHSVALRWLDDKLSEVMTSDFKENAQKFRHRLETLKF